VDDRYLEICRRAILEVTGREYPNLKMSDRLTGDLGLESIDVLELIFVLERITGKRLSIENLMSNSQTPNGRFSEIQIEAVISTLEKIVAT
jgi:acyl carrier protein